MQDLPDYLVSQGVSLKKSGDGFMCKCFAHDDSNPSMSVYINDGGKWVAHCHSLACDFHEDLLGVKQYMEGIGFKEAKKQAGEITIMPIPPAAKWKHSIPPEDNNKPASFALPNLEGPTQVWTYYTPDNKVIGYVARYIAENGEKSYRPWTFGTMSENISPKWQSKIWADPRPLYGLEKLAADKDSKVCIVEGEKAADAAQQLISGMVCITWPGGSSAIRKIDWQPLANRSIVLIPDADIAGERAMTHVARILLSIGCTVRYVDSSAQPKGWDLADALEEGWTSEQVITWARENIKVVSTDYIDKKLAEQERLSMTEKKTPELSVIENNAEPKKEYVEEQHNNVVALREKLRITDELPEEFSDFALSKLFIREYGNEWRYTTAWNTWFVWDQCRWRQEKNGAHLKRAQQLLTIAANSQDARGLSPSMLRAVCSVQKTRTMMEATAWELNVPDDKWDSEPFILGTPGGIVDLRTGIMRGAIPNDAITKITAVTPKKGAHPIWDSMLARCTHGDPDMLEYYQKWFGYCLTGDCREEGFLFFHGAGGSGKSKVVDCIGDILGDYCMTAKIEMLMESKIERHTEEIASLVGARMVRTSEPEEGSRWNEALLKLLTGRDTVSARRLYEKQFTFRPQFKLVVSGNFKPALKSTGPEIARRMHFVEFPAAIPESEQIKDLPERLKSEWPAILAWMIEGCLKWQQEGLKRPELVNHAITEYLTDEDTLAQWIEECCVIGANYRVTCADAYKSYRNKIEEHGEFPVSQKRFSQRMESRGFYLKKSGGTRYITGIALKY